MITTRSRCGAGLSKGMTMAILTYCSPEMLQALKDAAAGKTISHGMTQRLRARGWTDGKGVIRQAGLDYLASRAA